MRPVTHALNAFEVKASAAESAHEGVAALVARLLTALKEHDAAGCADVFTDDAHILSSFGPEVRGKAAIEATHRSWFDAGETNKRLELLESGVSGELGYCILAYAADYRQPDGSYATERGKSLNVLTQQADGEWKIYACSLTGEAASVT